MIYKNFLIMAIYPLYKNSVQWTPPSARTKTLRGALWNVKFLVFTFIKKCEVRGQPVTARYSPRSERPKRKRRLTADKYPLRGVAVATPPFPAPAIRQAVGVLRRSLAAGGNRRASAFGPVGRKFSYGRLFLAH